MKQELMTDQSTSQSTTKFLFSEDLFPNAYIEYMDIKDKSVKSAPAKSGQTIFKYHKIQFHHISVGGNKVDYLVHDGIVICSFGIKKDRNEIYEFLDKHWDERIEPFCKYIRLRREDEAVKADSEVEELYI